MHIQATPQEFAELLNLAGKTYQSSTAAVPTRDEDLAAGNPSPNLNRKAARPTKENTYADIIALLRSEFPDKGFSYSDAFRLVAAKLGKGHTTARNALGDAQRRGIIMRRNQLLFFVDLVQSEVKKEISQLRQPPPAVAPAPA